MNVVGAVQNNNTRILQLLVAVPGSVPKKNLNQALCLACKNGYAEAAKTLLGAGADRDFADGFGNTVLKMACEAGHLDTVKELIEANCYVNLQIGGRGTVLHAAAKQGQYLCIKELIKAGAKLNVLDANKNTALHISAQDPHRCMAATKVLVQAGCDLDLQNNKGHTALHYACHKAIGPELLLAAGADPNIEDNQHNVPLHMASMEGFDAVVKCLVEYGCKTDVKNEFGKTALHYLAMKNHAAAIIDIGHAGGHVNVVDRDNHTPLWYAVNHNRPDAVKALLRANCAVDPLEGPNGEKLGGHPLELALEKQLYGIAKLLVLAGCQVLPLYPWLERNFNIDRNEEEEEYSDSESSDSDESINMDLQHAFDWFEDWMHCPHSLRQLCRIAIRRIVGPCLLQKDDYLPLPAQLRDYVTLREVEDHVVPAHLI